MASGQSVMLSSPRQLGAEAQTIEISRDGEVVIITKVRQPVVQEAMALNE
ncbi:hypothetical protein G3T14_20180 [Methylobacterium sp. BTF04]|nr:hypothetical protein [Methylobacterium sp. BTF04]NEU14424.1 hypothetical protein [Methylobacterium sp. BTF04]